MRTRPALRRLTAATLLAAALAPALTGCEGPRALQYIRDSGDRAYKYENYQLARAEYAEVVDRDPGDWRTRLSLGKTLLKLGDAEAAREHLEVAVAVNPQSTEAVEALAEALLAMGDNDALYRFLATRADDRRAVKDYLRLGYFTARAGDPDAAERALLTAARLDRGATIEPQLALANFYEAVGDDDRALRRLRMALYIDPENTDVQQRIRAYGQIPGPTYALEPNALR